MYHVKNHVQNIENNIAPLFFSNWYHPVQHARRCRLYFGGSGWPWALPSLAVAWLCLAVVCLGVGSRGSGCLGVPWLRAGGPMPAWSSQQSGWAALVSRCSRHAPRGGCLAQTCEPPGSVGPVTSGILRPAVFGSHFDVFYLKVFFVFLL